MAGAANATPKVKAATVLQSITILPFLLFAAATYSGAEAMHKPLPEVCVVGAENCVAISRQPAGNKPPTLSAAIWQFGSIWRGCVGNLKRLPNSPKRGSAMPFLCLQVFVTALYCRSYQA
jgi:hypothetical protein